MKKIDLSKIQELENENDAYWMDRKGNIGVLKFVGECDGSHYEGQRSRLYKRNGKLEYIVTRKGFKEIRDKIKRNGLCPYSKNNVFNYPSRISKT